MDLRAEILALCSPELLAQRDTQAIAEAVSVGRVKRVPADIGNGTILATIGIVAGNALLDAIAGTAEYRHVKPLLEQGRLRVDSDLVRATLDGLVPSVLTAEQAQALKALGEQPDPVDEYAVRCIAWSDDGVWQL